MIGNKNAKKNPKGSVGKPQKSKKHKRRMIIPHTYSNKGPEM